MAGLHYDPAFLTAGDRAELVAWIDSLQPLWEQRFSKNNPPPPEIAARLVHRKDDTTEAVMMRVQKYHSETTPIIPFYLAKGILKRVDGVGDPDIITQRITSVLSS